MPGISEKLAAGSIAPEVTEPLWTGPNGTGPNGGVTQGLLGRWLVCRERARIHLIEGLRPPEQFNRALHYGQMWHMCEESLAAGVDHERPLTDYCRQLCRQFPLQQTEVTKWYRVCQVQFPEYVKWWAAHPDVTGRTPLLQEAKFDVPYTLPSGRKVRLRGKWDSVDLVDSSIWLKENKSKADVDEPLMMRMLTSGFEIQTMLYLTALMEVDVELVPAYPIAGVCYNVVRRPLSGGRGTITQKQGKPADGCGNCGGSGKTPKLGKVCSKCRGTGCVAGTPAETDDEFYARLLNDYIAKEPETYFFRWQVRILPGDVARFKRECLDPILEQLCTWYDEVTGSTLATCNYPPPQNYRMPYGVYSTLVDGGVTEVDRYADSGDRVGLERTSVLFPELED
jgi:hypothetical protein